MTVTSRAVTVTATATRLDATTDQDDAISGQSVAVYNDSDSTIFIGGPSVTSSGATKGAPVAAGAWGPGMDLSIGDQLYGITASGSKSMLVFETGVG